MSDLRALRQLAGKAVDLEFTDGHIVRAMLIAADDGDPGEIMYRVIEVLVVGPPNLATVKPGTVASANPALLKTYRAV
jgi:hypothetical protein